MYDPRIGRFSKTDRLAYVSNELSPYIFAGNSPMRYVDINGDFRIDAFFAKKYPYFAHFVEYILPELKYPKRFRKYFMAHSNFSDAQLDEMLSYGSGPWITVTLGNDGGDYDYHFFPENLKISEHWVLEMEGAFRSFQKTCDADLLRLYIFRNSIVMIHEMAHYGNFALRTVGNALWKERDEQGAAFEKRFFGEQFRYRTEFAPLDMEVVRDYFQSGGLKTDPLGSRTYLIYEYDYDLHGASHPPTKGQEGDPWLKDNEEKKLQYRSYENSEPRPKERR